MTEIEEVKNIREAGEVATSPVERIVVTAAGIEITVGKLPWMQFGAMFKRLNGMIGKGVAIYLNNQKRDAAESDIRIANYQLGLAEAAVAAAKDGDDIDALDKEVDGWVANRDDAERSWLQHTELVKESLEEIVREAMTIPEVVSDLVVGSTKLQFKAVEDLDFDDVLMIAIVAYEVNFKDNKGLLRFFDGVKALLPRSAEPTPLEEPAADDQ